MAHFFKKKHQLSTLITLIAFSGSLYLFTFYLDQVTLIFIEKICWSRNWICKRS